MFTPKVLCDGHVFTASTISLPWHVGVAFRLLVVITASVRIAVQAEGNGTHMKATTVRDSNVLIVPHCKN